MSERYDWVPEPQRSVILKAQEEQLRQVCERIERGRPSEEWVMGWIESARAHQRWWARHDWEAQ
jgi:hypothetical protein